MKRVRKLILNSVLTLSLLIGMIPSSLAAGLPSGEPDFSVKIGDTQLYFNIIDSSKNTVELVIPDDAQDASSYSDSIEVPAQVSKEEVTYKVTAIGDRAFRNSNVTSLTLPDSITSIGGSAFEGCEGLTALVLPDNVTEIGGSAFRNCSALTSISVPSGVKTLYSATFSGCTSLTTVTLPEGLETIESQVFMGCRALSELEIPDSVVKIGANAFSGCSANVTIPAGVTSGLKEALVAHGNISAVKIAEGSPYALDHGVLYNETTLEGTIDVNVTEVTVRDGTTAIANNAFAQQTSPLEKITFPDTLVSIGENAFKGCTELETADLPSNLKSIGTSAFEGCESLTKAIIPSGVTEIPNSAFAGCLSLKRIELSEGITSIGEFAFDLTKVNDDYEYVNDNPKLESINIPSSVTNVGENFLGGVKADGDTALIFEGNTPPTFGDDALAGISGDGVNQPAVYFPAKAVDVYTAEGSALITNGLVSAPSEDGENNNQYSLTVTPSATSVYENNTITFTVESTLPKGATLVVKSSNAAVAMAELSEDQKGVTITGVNEGTASITVSIECGTVVLASESITVTVNEYGTSGNGSSSSTTYAVSVEDGKNGSVSVSPKRAEKGDTVTITVKPDTGYELDALTVTDKNGDELKLTKKNDTQYTFTMPGSKVEIEASFVKSEEEPAPGTGFVDVPADAYYAEAVAWAVENGITNGTSATTFGPDASCTRAQMVAFLWRAAGSPAPKTTANPFTDVQADAYYYDAVLWAVENGVTTGTSATTFSPDVTVTRAQTVTFLYRNAGSPAVGGNSFADVAADAYYANAVAWAVAEGITNGTGGNEFSPDADCTRAQIVTFLYRDAQ